MENQLWNLFLETGDPMSYLLYRAEKNSGEAKREKTSKQEPPEATASV